MSDSKVKGASLKKEASPGKTSPAPAVGKASARLEQPAAAPKPEPKAQARPEPEQPEEAVAGRFDWLKPAENEPKSTSRKLWNNGSPPADPAKVGAAVEKVKADSAQPVSQRLQTESLKDPAVSAPVVEQTQPELEAQFKGLADAPPEQVESALGQLADVAQQGGEDASKLLATNLVQNLPLGTEGVYSGLTGAGLDGKPELATAVHDRLVQLQNDPALDDTQKAAYAAQALQLEQVLKAPEVYADLQKGLPQGSGDELQAAYSSAQKLNELSGQEPPGVAQALTRELAESGGFDKIAGPLQNLHDRGLSANLIGNGNYNDPASPQDSRTLTPEQQLDAGYLAQSTILNLSELSRNLHDPAVTDKVADSLVQSLQNGEYQGGWDAQFGYSVAQGGGSDLALSVATKLHAQHPGKATGLIGQVAFGQQILQKRFENSADTVDQLNADLAQIHANFGDKFTPEELAQADAEFLNYTDPTDPSKSNLANYQRNDVLGGALASDAAALDKFSKEHPELSALANEGPANGPSLNEINADTLKQFPRWASTAQGSLEVSRALKAGPGYLDQLATLAVDNPEQFRKDSGIALAKAAFTGAADTVENRDPNTASLTGLAQVQGIDQLLGVPQDQLRTYLDSVAEIARSGAQAPGGLTDDAVTSQASKAAKALSALQGPPGIISLLGAAGSVLGITSYVQAFGESDALTQAGKLSSALGGVTGLGGQLVKSDVLTKALQSSVGFDAAGLARGLARGGLAFGAATTALSLVDGFVAASEGDTAGAAKSFASAAGTGLIAYGGLSAAGGPITAAGAALFIGSQLIYEQYKRVEFSNRLEERPDVLLALDAAVPGVPLDTWRHLTNANEYGQWSGFALDGVAERAGLSSGEFFHRLIGKSPDEVLAVINQSARLITPERPVPHDTDPATDQYAGYQVVYVGGGGPNNSYVLQDAEGNRVLDAQGVPKFVPDYLVYPDASSGTNFRYQSNSYAGFYNALNQIDPSLLAP